VNELACVLTAAVMSEQQRVLQNTVQERLIQCYCVSVAHV
jgi:hypothetical protein